MPYIVKLLNQINNKRIFFLLILSFTGSTLLLILITGFIFTYWFSKESLTDINNMAELALSNVCLSVENSFESGKKSIYEIYNYPNIKNILLSDKHENNDIYIASLYLNYLLVSTPNLYSIYLYNGESVLLNVGGNYKFTENSEEISNLINSNRILSPIYRKVKDENGNLMEFYTFIYTDSAGSNGNNPSVVINYKAKDIYNQVYSKFTNPSQDIIITDTQGIILMNRNMDMLFDDISKENFFKLARGQSKEYFNYNADHKGENCMFNFISFGNGKYKAFLLSDYNTFFTKTIQIRNTIIIICLLLLPVVVFLSLYFSYSLYSPINNIYSNIRRFLDKSRLDNKSNLDIKFISSSISSLIDKLNDFKADEKTLKESFIKEIISTDTHISDEFLTDGLSKYDFFIHENVIYSVAIFRIGHTKQFFSQNTTTAIHFQLDSIENIILKVFQEDYKSISCQINDEHIMLIVSFQHNMPNDIGRERDFINAVKSVQDTVFQLFKIEMTIGISNLSSHFTIHELRKNYKEAYSLTNYRLFYDRMSIFIKNNIKIQDIRTNVMASYLDSILKLVKAGDLEGYKHKLKMLFMELKHCHYDGVINIFFELAQSIRQISANFHMLPLNKEISSSEELFNMIKSSEDYDELEKWFVDTFLQTNDTLLNIKGKKAQDNIKSVVEYIERNYSDFNLSANLMSEKLSFTPQYFSKIFRKYTGFSFPVYVNNVKLEKATELLLQKKNMTITEICEKIGFGNIPYFTNSFTQKYGISPAKYRQINKDKNVLHQNNSYNGKPVTDA